MCDPLSPILQGVAAVATVYSAVGSYYASKEEQVALRAEADAEEVNAQLMEESAEEAKRLGGIRLQRTRLQTKALKGMQRANIAANGIDLSSQSAVSILTSTDVLGNQDAKELTRSTLREAYGYKTGALNALTRAQLRRSRADVIRPGLAAATTLLSGATDVAALYYSTPRGKGVQSAG